MVEVGHDPNTDYDAGHSVRRSVIRFADLGAEKARRLKLQEEQQIDSVICPTDPRDRKKTLRAGISKRGEFKYYREDSGGWSASEVVSTLGQRVAVQRYEKTNKIVCRYGTSGVILFYRE